MTNNKRTKIPQGSETVFFEEAYIHRKLTEALNNLFNSWGYLPVETPVFDLFDAYRPLIPAENTDKVYRLIDRDGDLLMLRSDITLFLARQMGLILTEKELPVRICYSDSILRHQDSDDISHNEFFQSGVELIGKPGFEGDIEILLLLSRTISLMDIPAEIHLGSRSLFNTVFKAFSENDKNEILKMTSLRNFNELIDFCTPVMGKEKAEKTAELFSYIGNAKDLKKFIDEINKDEINYLINIVETLEKAGCADNVHIDLSEAGSQSYHTGIVFQVYMQKVDSAIISGGRYDSLLSNFGIPAPSVGFSMLQRKIEPGIKNIERFALPKIEKTLEESDIVNSFKKAEKLRSEGKIVTL
ncbi:MAG: ATP phosphoribosyltransferase regulatory subunit [Spirochaetales bacterium]|nr:ATP phosphoribosyltransferase regulatory subunit [Spirochaetales bacterium]